MEYSPTQINIINNTSAENILVHIWGVDGGTTTQVYSGEIGQPANQTYPVSVSGYNEYKVGYFPCSTSGNNPSGEISVTVGASSAEVINVTLATIVE